MTITFYEFATLFVQEHRALFESELGQNGQFDELIYDAYDDYVKAITA